MSKDEVLSFLSSEVFLAGGEKYKESQLILDHVKQTILLNIDKPGVDLVDLIHFSVASAITLIVKTLVPEGSEAEDNSIGSGFIS